MQYESICQKTRLQRFPGKTEAEERANGPHGYMAVLHGKTKLALHLSAW